MITFKDFILKEMADETGELDNKQFSKEYDWNKFYKDSKEAIVVLDKIGSEHYRLYRVYSTFYLTSETDEYRGQLELQISGNTGIIKSSNSKIHGGFYNIIFTSILALNIVNELRSDVDLSTNAIESYLRLTNNPKLLVRVYDNGEYLELSKKILLSNPNYRVSVIEKHGVGTLKEHFIKYFTRILEVDENEVPSAFNRSYLEYSSGLDNYLFGQNFITEVEIHNTLNDKLWIKDKLNPEVYKVLKEISVNFIKFLGIDENLVKDIIFTGSNANFNYHQGSDIDIHIELDTSKFKCFNVDDFLKTKKTLWNEQHDITIYGYDVELYAESSKDHPVTNAGLYSIHQNKWLFRPTKVDIDNIDQKAVNIKADVIKHQIDNIIENKVNDINSISKINNIIKNMRVEGINTNGEYSIENLAFKVLRDEGYLEKLSNYNNNLIDNNLSLK